jgi:hypothetical protein
MSGLRELLITYAIDRLRGQLSEFQATEPEVRFRFPALPYSLRISGSGTGSTETREYN